MAEFGKLNYINVGPDGTFARSGEFQTLPNDVDALFAALEAQPPERLALHFHGGLIKEASGFEIAEKMFKVYDAAGSHSIAFVWETGLIETIVTKIDTIGRSDLFRKLLKLVLKQAAKRLGFGLAADLARGGAGLTEAEMNAELAKDRPFEKLDTPAARSAAVVRSEADLASAEAEIQEELEAEIEADASVQTLLEANADELRPGVAAEIEKTGAKGPGLITIAKLLAKVTFRVIKRFFTKRDHGFYPTVVEEILRELYIADAGEWVWGGMKTKAEEMWGSNDGRAAQLQYAGTYFLDALAAYYDRHPATRIDLIGHSAGSIAIGHMLDAVASRHPNLRFRNVLLLAPACTSQLLEGKILPRLGQQFSEFRMFTMHDDFESQDSLLKGVYTRSLLYFISGVLEDEVDKPIAGMHRYLSGEKPYTGAPYDTIRTFLDPTVHRIVLSKTKDDAGAGLASHALSHGIFDDDPTTCASLQHIIRQ